MNPQMPVINASGSVLSTIACDVPGCHYSCSIYQLQGCQVLHSHPTQCVDVCHSCFSDASLSAAQRACFQDLAQTTLLERCTELANRYNANEPVLPQLAGSSLWWRMKEAWPEASQHPMFAGVPDSQIWGGSGLPRLPAPDACATIYEGTTQDFQVVTFDLPAGSPAWRLPEIMKERKLHGVTKVGKRPPPKRTVPGKKDRVKIIGNSAEAGQYGILIGLDGADAIVKLEVSSDIRILLLKDCAIAEAGF